ncbi:uncharacterized protein LOC135335845 isoform X3 [Halichondria panicea]|uniref:uncharacterized protein LOC135335845 isoform X3 n=1 Tax=Halichondria panicea TaxID=6063 RepID=UPI00312B8C82
MASLQSLCSVLVLSVFLHTAIGASDNPTLDVNPNAPKTRGSRFALAFMQNHARTAAVTEQQIGLFITTEQESSRFTLETRWPGVNGAGFTETSPGSGLWSRTEIAQQGEFTFINLPAGRGGQQDIAVQNNGETDEAERQKGLFITAENANDELTIYVLSDELVSTDAYMAINCVEFPGATDYKYFIFSSDVFGGERFESRFLFTPCQDDTTVSVQASQTQTHPSWVQPSSANPSARVEATYGRTLNRFDTVMISNLDDLTGSIITSDKPLAVFSGHQCGTPTDDGTCDYLVEQLPPHPTYGDLFFMAPFAVRQSGELYRIGSLGAGAQVTINCECLPSSADGNNRVGLVSAGNGVYTATVGAGQYAECQTPQNAQTYCCVTSSQPVTMASYTLGNLIDNLQNIQDPPLPFNPIGDPALVYIPPANSYLNSYSLSTAKNLTTQFQGFLSYILPTRIFNNSPQDQQRFRINGETYIPDQYEAINCLVDGSNEVCAYGATRFLGVGNFDISYDNIESGAFWGFAYGYAREVSFAYPLPFEMEPVGLAWIRAVDQVVLETVGTVDLMFSITRGDQSERSRAFAETQDLSAIEGSDYSDPPPQRNGGPEQNGNLRWGRGAMTPNTPYVVTILDDDIPEPVEVVEVIVQCVAGENCYLPRTRYTITIIDDQGACLDLPAFSGGSISYNFRIFPEIGGRPYGAVATYECDDGSILVEPTRTCENGAWSGSEPSCGMPPGIEIMFSMAIFSFAENVVGGQGFVDIVSNIPATQSFTFNVNGGPSTQDFVVTSAAGLPGQVTFPTGQTSVRVPFTINNDEVGLEDLESYLASLSLTSEAIAAGVSLGAISQASVQVVDDDEVRLSVGQTTYSAQESDGSVTLSYVLNREAVRDVSFDVINTDGTATGGGVDYDSAGYSLNIPARQTSVSRTVAITMDSLGFEGDENFVNGIFSISTVGVGVGDPAAMVTIQDSDGIEITFSMAIFLFAENVVGGQGFVDIMSNIPAAQSFTFNVNGGPSTQDFVVASAAGLPGQVTFPAGQTSVRVPFTINNDEVGLEDLESYLASLSLTPGAIASGVSLGAISQASVQVVDDDEVRLSVGQTTYSAQESDGSVTLSYVLNREAVRDVSFDVINTDGTATGGGVDYDSAGYSLNIPARQTSVTRSVSITMDGVGGETPPETFNNSISSINTVSVADGPAEATVQIMDSDVPVTVSFGETEYNFVENEVTGTIRVVTSRPSPVDFSFTVTAPLSDTQFISPSGGSIDFTATFPAGASSFDITFPITDDVVALEAVEELIATLSLNNVPTGVELGTPSTTVIRIQDDDEFSVGFVNDQVSVSESNSSVTLNIVSTPAARPVEITVITQDIIGGVRPATADIDYNMTMAEITIPAFATSAGLNVGIITDVIVEGDEVFRAVIVGAAADEEPLPVSQPQSEVTIVDDDVVSVSFTMATFSFDEGSGTGSVTIVKNGATNFPFDIRVTGGPSTQTGITVNAGGIDSIITFPADQQMITIDFLIGDDDVGLEVLERYIANLEIIGSPSGVVTGTITSAEVQVRDDDEVSVGFNVESVTVEESDGMFRMCVRLNRPAAENIIVSLATQDGSAIDGQDYNSSSIPSELLIAAGETEACFMGDIIEDGIPGEGTESFTIVITGVDQSGVTISRDTTQVIIQDSDDGSCDALPGIDNGEISYNIDKLDNFPDGTVATYTCNSGYILMNGDLMRTCEVQVGSSLGSFGGTEPECIPLCDELAMITNGMIVYNADMTAPYDVGTVATYSCNPGFELVINPGSEMRTCADAGDGSGATFSGQAPTCEAVCDELTTITNGVIVYNVDMTAPYDLGTVATYSCNPGFGLRGGNVIRTCMDAGDGSDGRFDGEAPTCEPQCPPLPEIANGMISYLPDNTSDYDVGTMAIYVCEDGFTLSRDETRDCQSDGTFSGMEPVCSMTPVCDELEMITNGVIIYTDDMIAPYDLDTLASYRCNPGFVLRGGNVVRTCVDAGDGSGGRFDGEAPTCEPQCPPLPEIANGMISYLPDNTSDYDVGTIASYVCEDGFTLNGDDTRNCQSDRTFSGMEPVCSMTPVCTDLPAIANGEIMYSSADMPRPIGTVASYTCNDGFNIAGPVSRTCVENAGSGMFDMTAPTCIPIECEQLEPLANGVITYELDTVAPYSLSTNANHVCNRGYRLVGTQVRVCEDVGATDGQFNQEAPICEQITCDDLPALANAVISYSSSISPRPVDTVATYECVDGYTLESSVTRTCQEDEMFDGEEPRCVLIPVCVELEPLVNGGIDYGGRNDPFSVGTVATYFCNTGYALVNGPDSKTCVESDEGTGVFDPPQTPTCDPECDQIFVPPNAIVTYNTEPVPPFPAGALAMFECVDGFSPGTTSPGQPFPRPGELILLECGEIVEGEGGVFVRNGTSSQIELSCTRDCVELRAISNGMISYSPDMTADYSAGTVATYTCDDGFELVPGVGNSMRTCLPVGQVSGADLRSEFDGAEPRCEPVCMELMAIPNGMISYSPDMTAPYSVDTVATYTCNSGFRFVAGSGVGDQMRTCTEVTESESTVVSGATFGGMAPSCEPVSTNMTTCTITDPMLVSPFTRSTSYTFMGTCEHTLLQSCDDSVDFMVRTDFLTDNMDNGAVGVFIDGASFISRENGSFESSETSSSISGVPGRVTEVYADSNVEVERGDTYTEIRVGGGIGVNVRHNYGDPSLIIVTVVTGSSLGETCGLCGTQSGDLRRTNGTIAEITDRAQVEAFTMDYLTAADQQALRPIRRECSAIRNDTVIGDPLYSVALTKTNGGPDNLCYEVRGSTNQNYNLISDECVSVNALYQAMDIPEFGNIMGSIGVRAETNDGRCYSVRVEREGCRALASDGVMNPAEINSTFVAGGISVRRYPNRVRISAPNCDQVTLVMWVRCVTREGQDMLDFAVSRGANLRPTSHGLLGQFWNIPVSSSPINGSFYTVTVNPDDSSARSFTAEILSRTWDKRRESCLYAGNSQGGSYNELQDSSFPADSVIQGRFSEYQTTGLYATAWRYSQFRSSVCSVGIIEA